MFSGLDLHYKADPARPLIAAGDELDDLDHDLLQTDQIDDDLSETRMRAASRGEAIVTGTKYC